MKALFCLLLTLSATMIRAQTQVDLKTQTKSVDFSGAQATKPVRTGTQLPASCSPGEMFFNTAAQPGANVFGCTAPNTWAAQSGLLSVPNYGRPFASVTSLVIRGTEHLMNTANVLVTCYDNSSPARLVEPDFVTLDPGSFDVTIGFAQSQSGRCILNGNGVNGAAAGGTVATVFGRTGGVISQTGDYSFAQVSGTVTDSQVAPGIDAAKVGLGTVTNAMLDRISGLSSDVQAQLDARAALVHSHLQSGDVSGDLAATRVTGLQGRAVAAGLPSDQQALLWSQTSGAWQPQTLPVSGAQMTWQLLDLRTTLDSTQTVLTLGANCGQTTPCVVRFGNTSYMINAAATATISGSSSGIAFIYVAAGGVLTVGHSMTVNCAGCSSLSGISAFPVNSIPLYTWTASNGLWDMTGAVDLRAMLSTRNLSSGSGLAMTDTGAQITLSVDSSVVPSYIAGTGSLNFGVIASGVCTPEMTFALSGAISGDPVAPGWPGTLPAGVLGTMRIPSAGVAGVQLCNWSGGAINVNAAFRATVLRSF